MKEIERRFLLTGLPSDEWLVDHASSIIDIKRGYLNGDTIEERFTKRTLLKDPYEAPFTDSWHRTVKIGHGIERLEFSEKITEEFYEAVLPLTVQRRLNKVRFQVRRDDLVWELDRCTIYGKYGKDDLFLAEVELSSVDQEAILPGFLIPLVIREVTNEREYEGYQLSLQKS